MARRDEWTGSLRWVLWRWPEAGKFRKSRSSPVLCSWPVLQTQSDWVHRHFLQRRAEKHSSEGNEGGWRWGVRTGHRMLFCVSVPVFCLFPRSDSVAGAHHLQPPPPPPPTQSPALTSPPLVAHISLSPFLYGGSTKKPLIAASRRDF